MYPPNKESNPVAGARRQVGADDHLDRVTTTDARAALPGEQLARETAERHRVFTGDRRYHGENLMQARNERSDACAPPEPHAGVGDVARMLADRLDYQRDLLGNLTALLENHGLLRPGPARGGCASASPNEKNPREPRLSERLVVLIGQVEEHSSAIAELLDRLDV